MKKYIIILAMLPILLIGCNDFLDINTDPNKPTNVSVSTLLPYAQQNMGYCFNSGSITTEKHYYTGITQNLGVYTHQITTREDAEQYRVDGANWHTNTSWRITYSSLLKDLDRIITKGHAEGNIQYVGIAKVMKAYTYSILVDTYAKIPYSEATSNVTYPKFDEGEDIYKSLFILLDDAINDLQNTSAANVLKPKNNDLIYNGDMNKWVRAAKTIKLKMLNQTRLVNNVQSDINALLTENDLIGSFNDGLIQRFGTSMSPENRNPAYLGSYVATQKSQYASPWFYEILKGKNPKIFTNIEDPRIPYYFYNQLKVDQVTRESGTVPDYRDGAFVSRYFGSQGPNNSVSLDGSLTVTGIYHCGGLFDDGSAIKVAGNSGSGAAPFRFITYADRLFIEAELIQSGLIAGDAKTKLSDAIDAAFTQVDEVVTLAKNSNQAVPKLRGSEASNKYKESIISYFESANSDKRMEIIITQKWISSFGNSVDQYTDYRRTSYPIMFDPNNAEMAPDGFVTTPEGIKVAVACPIHYPRSMPWPNEELTRNENAPVQKTDLSNYKVFWDK